MLRGNYHAYTSQLHAKYGPLVRIGYSQVLLANPSEMRRILATHNFRKGAVYERNSDTNSTLFSTSDPELYKIRRRQMGNVYAMPTLRLLEDIILEDGVLSLTRLWDSTLAAAPPNQKSVAVNYHYGFHGMGYDIIGALGFGQSFNVLSQGDDRVTDAIHSLLILKILKGIVPFFPRMRWMFKSLNAARSFVFNTGIEMIKKRRDEIKATGKPPRIDILQKLLDASDPETGEVLDESSLLAEIFVLLIAGTETTSNTLTWTLMNLMHYPSVYQRLRDDVRREFPDHSTPIRYEEARARLPYLTAVINECMRLNTVAAGCFTRRVPEEGGGATVCGYFIPAGSADICLGFAACHLSSEVWTEPAKFDPERFMGPDTDSNLKNILAFSSGARMCIGRNLAWIELYAALANLLRTYNFKLPANAPYGPHRLRNGIPEEIPGITFATCTPIKPTKNCWIEIERAF
ncbi:hypothetical protein EV174_002236 [Coemansia sp. RSA 2320]|nr:hypothetical protein EV174_002236 [Coemansia sp. RSA 2320]